MHICLMHMLQLIEGLQSVTNGPQLNTLNILNKYFARSTWIIFTFPSLNAIFEKSQRSFLTDINMYLLPEFASMVWNSIKFVFQSTRIFCLEDVEVLKTVHIFS